MSEKNNGKITFYKEIPMISYQDYILYGVPTDSYIVKIDIESYSEANDEKIPDDLMIMLIDRNDFANGKTTIIRQKKAKGLCDALDISIMWLKSAQEAQQ